MFDLDKDQLTNNILELTINDAEELIKAAIKLYNELQRMTMLDKHITINSLEKNKTKEID